jgi:hypothetical protein
VEFGPGERRVHLAGGVPPHLALGSQRAADAEMICPPLVGLGCETGGSILQGERYATVVCVPVPGDGRRSAPIGLRATEVVASVDVAQAMVYRLVRQDRIDRGELAGTSSVDNAELRAAKRRIAELESELAVIKRASALSDEGRVVRPRAVFDIVETLVREGHGTKRGCRLLRVAPSGFFRWRAMPPSERSIRRAWLTDVIVEIYDQSRRTPWVAADPR